MFTGLSAFPLTPATDEGIDEAAYERIVGRLADAGVDSIGALGSTGSYAYLSRQERARAATIAVQGSGTVPVIVGVGALRTRDILLNIEDAQNSGAAAVLLAPMTYQALTEDEAYRLYEEIAGILPEQCLAIARAAIAGKADEARALSAKMDPLWALFARYGSYRVTSAVAEDLGLVSSPNLPRPVRSLDEEGRRGVAAALEAMGVRA